jgi:hypothetical protein
MDETKLLDEYLELKSKISELEEKLELLKPAVFDFIDDKLRETNEKYFPFRGFKFELQYRTSYNYSEEVFDMESRLKEIKKQEERDGIAKAKSQTGFVRVLANKE